MSLPVAVLPAVLLPAPAPIDTLIPNMDFTIGMDELRTNFSPPLGEVHFFLFFPRSLM